MEKLNLYLTIVLKLTAIAFVLMALYHPETIGYWQAQNAIAYDSIWGEYVMDCDCTESLE